jgi:hypothetical protein
VELRAAAAAIREEVEKLTGWRKRAVASLVTDGAAAPEEGRAAGAKAVRYP